jgi:phage-related protein
MKNEKAKNKSIIFQAKNVRIYKYFMITKFSLSQVRPNAVRLRMPVWVTDFQFIDERNRCLVVTGHHQVSFFLFTSVVK